MSKRRETAAREALRIIEAAGDGETEDVDFAEARYRLRCSVQKTAEREAEDAKVREFFEGPCRMLMGTITDEHRRLYHAAQEYFLNIVPAEAREEKPAPRVLNYGDPEPDRDTRWRDTGGNVWSFGNICHRDYPVWRFESAAGSSFGRWTHLDSCFFPMTEVVE